LPGISFLLLQGSSTDWLGFDNGARALPAGARLQNMPIAFSSQYTPEQVNSFVSSFNPVLGTETKTSFLDYSASVSLGNQKKINNSNEGTLGYMFSLSYKNDYAQYNDYFNGEYQRFSGSDIYDLRYANIQEGVVSEQNTTIGTLAVLAYKKKYSKIRLTAMHLQNGEKRAGQFMIDNSGEAVGQSGYLGQRDNIEYNQRSLTNILLNGIHKFNNSDWELDWKISPTLSTSNDPDIRVAGLSIGGPKGYQINAGEVGNPQRVWRSLSEANLVNKIDITKKYKFNKNNAKLKFGSNYSYKVRDYEILTYNWVNVGGQLQFEDYNLNSLISPENIYPNGINAYYQSGNSNPNPNAYSSTATNTAFYISNEAELLPNLNVILGLRGENFVQRYTGGVGENLLDNEKVLDAFDLFPSANLIYALTGNMNFRFAYSKTIARPSFKELSFAQIIDPLSNRIFNGSLFQYSDWGGQLVETRIDNFDVRWEFFQNRGQMISVSAFMKQFENPIELVRIPEAQTSSDFQPRNVGNGKLHGIEFEVRKNLEFITPVLQNFSFNTNITFIKSQIEMTDKEFNSRLNYEKTGETISDTRAMAGQSPFVINAGLIYNNMASGIDAGLFYNIKGKTLEIISSGLYPDVYLNPFNSLNFSFNKKLGKNDNTSIDFKISNILNDSVERVFSSFNTVNQYFTKFTPGTSFSLGLSYKF
jgi:outer membrane receptor protein involved in Fe transport